MRLKPNRARARKTAGPGRLPRASYYQGKAEPSRSPFAKKTSSAKSQSDFLSKAIDVSVIGAVTFCLVYSLIVRAEPKLTVDSQAYNPASAYQATARAAMGGLINRNKITFNEQAVAESLQKEYPEISNVSVGLPLVAQNPAVQLNIAAPAFLFNSGGAVYIVSEDGVAVGPASRFPSIKNLPEVVDQSGFKLMPGTRILGSDNVSFIAQVVAQAKKAKVPLASLTLPPRAQELDLRTSDRPYYVKFYLGGDPLTQTGQFLAARKQFDEKKEQPADYLDVRVVGKIFYR